MHPTTPPTPSRRAPRAPKNPRRRVRSESDRKKHAGWRHCPRCNRSVSTNGRNFYHHMHKCDKVYFADLIAKVDSAITPVSTPLPPPLPRTHTSPITPTHTPNPTPVKMSENQRVIFLQQLCFLRVYDRTVDAVLNQIEKTDASIFSPAAFEAVRRAKRIETRFPNHKPFSPPYSPLAPTVHPSHQSRPAQQPFTSPAVVSSGNIPSNPLHITSQPPVNTRREPPSNVSSATPQLTTPYTSNGSLSVSTPLSGSTNPIINPPGNTSHPIASTPPSGNGSATILPHPQRPVQSHSISGLSSTNGHMSRGLPVPASSALPGTVTCNLGVSQPSPLHSRPITVPDGRPPSESLPYSSNMCDPIPGITIPPRLRASTEIPVSRSGAVPSSGALAQGSGAIHGTPPITQNRQAFSPTANIGNTSSDTRANLTAPSSVDQPAGGDGCWNRDAQRFSAPTGTAPYSGVLYTNQPLPAQPQASGVSNASAVPAAAANTPVSRVASAMSISSVINT